LKDILAIDIGTTKFKMGVFSSDLSKSHITSRDYEINLYDQDRADIEPEKWWLAFKSCCAELKEQLSFVGVIALSVTTPGLVPMDEGGRALGPAILFLDGRSNKQSKDIRARVGEDYFLERTCNLPVSGGSSLASILWIRDNQPELWASTVKFGHCNSYFTKRLTGHWAIDPSTTSITGLYNTAQNDLTWNENILALAGIPHTMLPPLMYSHSVVGEIKRSLAEELGLPTDAVVLCGGNDAVLSCLSGGITTPGVINNIQGTCEITAVCVDHPLSSPNFNVRCHVIPGLWLSFFVLNTGGIALEWFHSVFCKDMTKERFFGEFVPSAIRDFLKDPDVDLLEQELPAYVPFLQGSRYSQDRETAGFSGLTLGTTREELLLSVLRGNEIYHAEHLKELAGMIELGPEVVTSGGGARVDGMMDVKLRWLGKYSYSFLEQSSLRGAAILGRINLNGVTGSLDKVITERLVN